MDAVTAGIVMLVGGISAVFLCNQPMPTRIRPPLAVLLAVAALAVGMREGVPHDWTELGRQTLGLSLLIGAGLQGYHAFLDLAARVWGIRVWRAATSPFSLAIVTSLLVILMIALSHGQWWINRWSIALVAVAWWEVGWQRRRGDPPQ